MTELAAAPFTALELEVLKRLELVYDEEIDRLPAGSELRPLLEVMRRSCAAAARGAPPPP